MTTVGTGQFANLILSGSSEYALKNLKIKYNSCKGTVATKEDEKQNMKQRPVIEMCLK